MLCVVWMTLRNVVPNVAPQANPVQGTTPGGRRNDLTIGALTPVGTNACPSDGHVRVQEYGRKRLHDFACVHR